MYPFSCESWGQHSEENDMSQQRFKDPYHCTPLRMLAVFQHFPLSKSLKDSLFLLVSCKYKRKNWGSRKYNVSSFFLWYSIDPCGENNLFACAFPERSESRVGYRAEPVKKNKTRALLSVVYRTNLSQWTAGVADIWKAQSKRCGSCSGGAVNQSNPPPRTVFPSLLEAVHSVFSLWQFRDRVKSLG